MTIDKFTGGAFRSVIGPLVVVVLTVPVLIVASLLLVSAFMGWLIWGWINIVRGVARTAPLMYLMPPMTGLFAWAWSGEHYTWIKIAGAGVILSGVALAQYAGQIKWRLR